MYYNETNFLTDEEKNKIESEKIILRGWVGKNSFFNRYDGSY